MSMVQQFAFARSRAAFDSRVAVILLLSMLSGLQPSPAFATGTEYTMRAADLELAVDCRWAGCRDGGYYPVRVQVTNKSLDRVITIEYLSDTIPPVPTVRRSISLGQNATANVTLSIPCVGAGTYGSLRVLQNGRLIKELTRNITLPDIGYGTRRPALLIVSPSNVDATAFETAVTSNLSAAMPSGYGGYYGSSGEDHEVVQPALLPESWIDYSGLDLVAIPLNSLSKLDSGHRSALTKWVHCGGTLIVYDVGRPAADSEELYRVLAIDSYASSGPGWMPANLQRRQKIEIIEMDEYGNMILPAEPLEDSAESTEEVPTEAAEEAFSWPEDEQTFVSRQLLLGHVFAFPANPFPGTAHDWSWFLKSIPNDQLTWSKRHGISARVGSHQFLEFLIPSVRGIPVLAFLLLITLFTIVIGPLNYLWLWRKRRLYLLVLTIPVIALTTSLALFTYSAFAHGFSIKSRSRSMTFIDQKSNTAVSISRMALFAGVVPRGGMRFSSETAVYPIWPENTGFQSGTVDWTDQQNLVSGWLPSRTRTQFLTATHRDERGRLNVNDSGGDTLEVTNGFEWGLQALVVADKQGRLFYGEDIPAGASSQLPLITEDNQKKFQQFASVFPLAMPRTSNNSNSMFDWEFNHYFGYNEANQSSYATNLAERRLRDFRQLKNDGKVVDPTSYAAILTESPGISLGVETRPEASLHILQGWY